MRFALIPLFLCAVFHDSAFGDARDFQGFPIVAIVFEPESQPLASDELSRLLPIQAGDALDLEDIRMSIERLYATGRYQDISVDALRRNNGVVLRFLTKGTWFVGRVTFEGVREPPNRGQLVATSKLELGSKFHNEDLQAAVENVLERLRDNGFHEARLNPELDYEADTQQVHIDFRVDAGPRARFTSPIIGGIGPEEFNRVVNATKWKRFWGLLGWKPLTESRLQQGLDRIRTSYSKRDYLLNRVTLEELDYSQRDAVVQPVIGIELGSPVEVEVTGAKVSRGRLRQLIPVFQEQSADRDLLVEGMRNLTEYFQAQGYFRVKVRFDTTQEAGGKQRVLYTVEPGERYKLVHLEIRGHRYFERDTIRERMNVTPATRLRFRRGRFSEAMLASDINQIRELYASNGFLEVKVNAGTEENYQGKTGELAVTLDIEEGPQTLVESLTISGVSPSNLAEIEPRLSSTSGQPFSEANLATDRDTILNYYYNHGYPDASLEFAVTQADVNRRSVRYEVFEGNQRYVRGVFTGGLQASHPAMVEERIRLSPGDVLSQSKLIESQRRLYDLGVFARVDMALQNPDGREESKYVVYQFEEARKYSLNIGLGAEIARIGAGTPNFDAPAGEPGFSPRISLGASRSNLFGIGHTAGIQTRFSNIQQRALFTYLAPQFKGREDLSLTGSALFDISRDIRTFESRRQEGSVQLGRRLSRANTLQTRFTYRRNTVRNLAIDQALIPIFSVPVRVGIASATFIQDRRDDPIDSRRGYYNSIDAGLASKAFLSETDFVRILARNSSYHQVFGDMILARTLTLGWLHNFREGGPDAIPLPERFFSGGAATHRGFPDNQAGPRDLTTGFPLGGSGLLMTSVELRFPLLGESIGGVLFHDAGNVYRRFREISLRPTQRSLRDFNYMVHASGFGIRYKTPVGPVRLDLAYSPNSPEFRFLRFPDPGVAGVPQPTIQRISRFQFHFSLGQTF
jgi:outer membrane protein insertion porin family